VIEAVVFDLDGVIVDTEQVWDDVRARLTVDWGGSYTPEAQRAMMGMSSTEWSRFMHDELGLEQSPDTINDEVVRRMLARYREALPLVPGAPEAVRRLHTDGLRLAIASSSNRVLIDAVLDGAGIRPLFEATVSSEEVPRGKPAPDVYLEAVRRLAVEPARCAAVEDSASGIRAAHAAGLRVLALPNAHYPPSAEVLSHAAVVIGSLDELTGELIRRPAAGGPGTVS
jgi:HAD superfamily hydrolase (TIGR01509 family)